ncbi:hypothetical protein Tcan_04898 [Toxocara canis]|uniref:Uncharacterized protein n=1 Tax=Toxocara canis TaxID=6265 RepID=A0A0B2VNW3_TOXCA|nr:hypothetical protein Tcan_04898 [Toxocara canis]
MLDRSCKACSMRVDRNRLMCSLFRGSVDGLHRLTREGVMLSVLRSSTSRLLRSCNAVCRINHPMLRHYHESRYQRIFQYLVESGEERFSASGVARSYAWDRLDAKQWLLIYRDSNASRTYALAAILFPTASIVAFILFIDFFKNGPRNRTAFVQKLCKDATEREFKIFACFAYIKISRILTALSLLYREVAFFNERCSSTGHLRY